jgi:formylglycine-generating enzyme
MERKPAAPSGVLPPEADTIILGEAQGTPGASADANAPIDLSADRNAASGGGHHGAAGQTAVAVHDILMQRFQLIELIGEGGMSRVFKAIDLHPGNAQEPYIAVKVLTRPFDAQFDSLASLQQEVQKLRSLSHPNIVRLFDCGQDGTTVFMTMEYLVGGSLYTKFHTPPPNAAPTPGLAADEALPIIAAIADALEYAHRHDVVHGDLKPGNVLVAPDGGVKVIDFGIASWIARPKTAFERREAAQSKPPSAVTPRYASPQLLLRHKPEAADDVYALACVAYEILTGSHPFYDDAGVHSHRFPPPRRAGLTPSQHAALVNGLQFERRNRTSSVRQLMDEFSAPPRLTSWTWRATWLAVAVLVLAIGWFYAGPLWKSQPHDAAVSTLTPEPIPPPTQAPPPAAMLKSTGVIQDCPTCPLMNVLPSGRFKQGSAASDADASHFERPQREVIIDYPFAMSANDVTVGDFHEFVEASGRKMQGCDLYDGAWHHQRSASWKDPGFPQTALHPVTCVSWNDAAAYSRWLSAKSGRRYRLPSASEWEYAARAGGETPQPWGSDASAACANANVADQSAARKYPGWNVFACDDGYANTSPVGAYKTNGFGLNDMLGNVFQWTQDCWHDDYAGAATDGSARMDGNCTEHELRGGSWFSSPSYVRASYRNHFAADYRTSSVGFRLVREISP